MSKRTIGSIAAGIVAAGGTAAQVWDGSNGWQTAGLAAGALIAIGLFAYFIIGKLAERG